MEELIRPIVGAYLEVKGSKDNLNPDKTESDVYINDITPYFISYADSEIQIERDGLSGAMTDIAYALRFRLCDKTQPIKALWESFLTNGRRGHSNSAFYHDYAVQSVRKGGEQGDLTYEYPFGEWIKGQTRPIQSVVSESGFAGIYSVRLLLAFGKDTDTQKPDLENRIRGELRTALLDGTIPSDYSGVAIITGDNMNKDRAYLYSNGVRVKQICNSGYYVVGDKGYYYDFEKLDVVEDENFMSLYPQAYYYNRPILGVGVDLEEFVKCVEFDYYKILNINLDTYKEEYSTIEFEASSSSLLKVLITKKDDVNEFDVSSFSTKNFVVDKNITLPTYSQHTFPFWQNDEGVKQSLMSTEDLDEGSSYVYYFPSVSWDGEVIGGESDVPNYVTFGNQDGYDIYTNMNDRRPPEYLLKNDMTISHVVKISIEFSAVLKYRVGSDEDMDRGTPFIALMKGVRGSLNNNSSHQQQIVISDVKLISDTLPQNTNGYEEGDIVYIYAEVTDRGYRGGAFYKVENSTWVTTSVEYFNYQGTIYRYANGYAYLSATPTSQYYQPLLFLNPSWKAHGKLNYPYIDAGFSTNGKVEIDSVVLNPQEEVFLVVGMNYAKCSDNESYSSHFYFNKNGDKSFVMTTYVSSAHAPLIEGRETINIGGELRPVLKGIEPQDVIERILMTWGRDFSLRFIRNLAPSSLNNNDSITYGQEFAFQGSADSDTLISEENVIPLILPVEVLNNKPQPKLYCTMKDLLEWFRVGGYEYSIQGNEMIIAPREYFFDYDQHLMISDSGDYTDDVGSGEGKDITTIGYDYRKTSKYGTTDPQYASTIDENNERGAVTLSSNNSLCYTHVQIGYDKEDYDVLGGTNDPVSVCTFTTGYESEEKKTLELTTKVRMDFYGMMYWVIRNYTEDYDKTNEDFFIVDSKNKSEYGDGSYYGFWDDLVYNAKIQQADYDVDVTYYNALRTPYMLCALFNKRLVGISTNGTLSFEKSSNWTPATEGDSKIVASGNVMGYEVREKQISWQGASDILNVFSYDLHDEDYFAPQLEHGEIPPLVNRGLATIKIGTIRKIWFCYQRNDEGRERDPFAWSVGYMENPNSMIGFIDDNNILRFGFIKKYVFNLYNYKEGEVELLLCEPKNYLSR